MSIPKLLISQVASMEEINEEAIENIELLTLSAEEPVADSLLKFIEFIS